MTRSDAMRLAEAVRDVSDDHAIGNEELVEVVDRFLAEQQPDTGADEKCTCGSGGHPRRCKKHPDGYERHIAELNLEREIEEHEAAAHARGVAEAFQEALSVAKKHRNNNATSGRCRYCRGGVLDFIDEIEALAAKGGIR